MRTSAFVVLHAKTQMKVSWLECLRCRRRVVLSMTAAQLGREEAGARWEVRLRVGSVALAVDGRTSTGQAVCGRGAMQQCSFVREAK